MKKYRGVYYEVMMSASADHPYVCCVGAFTCTAKTTYDMEKKIDQLLSIVTNLTNAGEEESE